MMVKQNIVAFTGAGISAESGIPTFLDSGRLIQLLYYNIGMTFPSLSLHTHLGNTNRQVPQMLKDIPLRQPFLTSIMLSQCSDLLRSPVHSSDQHPTWPFQHQL